MNAIPRTPWLLLPLLLWSTSIARAEPEPATQSEYRIGILAKRGPERCLQMWQPTAEYLTAEIPGATFSIIPLDFEEIFPAVAAGEVDFVFANSAFYAQMEVMYGISRVVTLKNLRPGGAYVNFGGVIFCRADRDDVKEIADLPGKRFMAVKKTSFGGWLMAWRELKDRGIDPHDDFAELLFGGTHDAVVLAVRDGKVDAGTVRTDTIERMVAEGKIDAADYRVLNHHQDDDFPFMHSTRLYPEWPMARLPHTREDLAKKVAIALLAMPPDSDAAEAGLCEGWTVPLSYQSVTDCLRELRVGPYAKSDRISLLDAMRQHWHDALIVTVLLVFSIAIAVHVTLLNRRLQRSSTNIESALAKRTHAEQQLRKANRQLEAAKEAAEQASRAKSAFLAGMSHELRTPLNAIIGMTELVLDTQLPSSQREYLKMVRDSGDSLLTLINDILDFSKVEAGKLDLEQMTFSLRDRVGDVMKSVALRAHDKDLELAYRFDPNVPDAVLGDPSRLGQVILNLVGNAIKFTSAGEVVLEVNADASNETDTVVRFIVRDTGIGIPKDKLATIFEAFSQADTSTTRRFGGTGLGLAISTRLVTLMGGDLRVKSQAGKGSTFEFTATFQLATEEPIHFPAIRLESIRDKDVLIVDDNQTNRLILEEMTQGWGMRPVAASNAQDALRSLREMRASNRTLPLVLSDVHMPDVDGLTMIEWIREDPTVADATVIVLTSGTRPDDVNRCDKLKVAARLIKPVKQSELIEAIGRALGMHVPERQVDPDASPDDKPELAPRNILLAEDSMVNQRLAVGLLEKHGHTVTVANNGREAVDILVDRSFDVVLMDVEMPELDGLEATATIRARERTTYKHIPIVAMTAHAMKGDRERCLAAGMDDYVSKPIRAQRLFDTLASVFERFAPDDFTVDKPVTIDKPVTEPSGIDWEQALESVDGDAELLDSVIEIVLEETPRLFEELRKALDVADADAVRTSAHTLKGSIRTFGPTPACELAQQLELMGRDGHVDNAREALETLDRELDKLLPLLAEHRTELVGRQQGA